MAKVRIEDELYRKIKDIASEAGYSSTDEFVKHLIEKEIDSTEGSKNKDQDKDKIVKRLEGLGYI